LPRIEKEEKSTENQEKVKTISLKNPESRWPPGFIGKKCLGAFKPSLIPSR
jgi:hypothetical protein